MPLLLVSRSPVALGLLAALTWGAADFAGGLTTRQAAPYRVVLVAHGASLALLAGFALHTPAVLAPGALVRALLSGAAGGAALMVFYEALAMGAMGLAAALAGLLTAVLPVLLALRTEGTPPPAQVAGFAVAALAIVLIAYAPPIPGAAPSRRALLLATVAGLGFGLQLVWLHSAAAAARPAPGSRAYAPVLWTLLLSRLGGALTAGTVWAGSAAGRAIGSRVDRAASLPLAPTAQASQGVLPLLLLAALAGLLDSTGNGLYMFSSLGGRLDVAAVLASLYPGATIALAAIFLHERATRLQAIGMGCALVAVGLIAT